MLIVLFSGSSYSRPTKKFFEYPLTVSDIEHRYIEEGYEGIPIDITPNDVILAMGGKVLKQYQNAGLIKKNLSLNKSRNKTHMIQYDDVVVPTIFSYDPSLSLLDPTQEPNIEWDINFALRRHRTGTDSPVLGDYSYVDNFDKDIFFVKATATLDVPILASVDLETIGLDEFAPEARIVTIQLTVEEGKSSVYVVPKSGLIPEDIRSQVEFLCTTPLLKLTGANLKFDVRWLKQHWDIWISNQTFDTGLVGAILNENRGNSLNLHAKLFTELGGYDDEFERSHDKSRMDLALESDPAGFLQYSGGDTDACYRTTKRLRAELTKDKKLTQFYVKLLQPATKSFAMMEHRGVCVDQKRYEELRLEVKNEISTIEKTIIANMSSRLRLVHKGKLKLTRADVLRDYLFTPLGLNLKPQMFTEKGAKPATHMEHLELFDDVPEAKEFIGLMRRHRSASKTLSTYIDGFMKHLRSDGKFHPAYRMFRGDYGSKVEGEVTGRTSATNPAVQTIPKHTKWAMDLRSVYVPPSGMAILKIDYSQGELRVAACVANEENMIATYRDGIDVHMRTGALVYGMTLEQALKLKDKKLKKKIRQGGKAGNFGLLYTMQPAGFVAYAQATYGVEMTLTQATDFSNAFFKEYPQLVTWHENSVKTAKKYGHVRSPLGRVRHLPLINSDDYGLRSQQERQCINSPIQCTLSDLGLLASSILLERYPDLWLFLFTHDELGFYVPDTEVELWSARIKEVMENLPLKELFGWDHQLTFVADSEYSVTNMAECIDLVV